MEIMYGDFSTLASDPLINHAAKMRFMTAGQVSVPLVYTDAMGSGTGADAQHTRAWRYCSQTCRSQGVYAATPPMPRAFESAVRDPDPVIFLEHKLYGTEGLVPDGEYAIPLGKADVKRQGSDVTIITYGKTLFASLDAAMILEDDEVNAEVIDLRSLRPLDTETILASVRKTGRVVVVHEAPGFGGFAGEVIAQIAGDAQTFACLKAPVSRVCGKELPTPFNKRLELQLPPSPHDIVEAVLRLFPSAV